jgi:hypothetical protein
MAAEAIADQSGSGFTNATTSQAVMLEKELHVEQEVEHGENNERGAPCSKRRGERPRRVEAREAEK